MGAIHDVTERVSGPDDSQTWRVRVICDKHDVPGNPFSAGTIFRCQIRMYRPQILTSKDDPLDALKEFNKLEWLQTHSIGTGYSTEAERAD